MSKPVNNETACQNPPAAPTLLSLAFSNGGGPRSGICSGAPPKDTTTTSWHLILNNPLCMLEQWHRLQCSFPNLTDQGEKPGFDVARAMCSDIILLMWLHDCCMRLCMACIPCCWHGVKPQMLTIQSQTIIRVAYGELHFKALSSPKSRSPCQQLGGQHLATRQGGCHRARNETE